MATADQPRGVLLDHVLAAYMAVPIAAAALGGYYTGSSALGVAFFCATLIVVIFLVIRHVTGRWPAARTALLSGELPAEQLLAAMNAGRRLRIGWGLMHLAMDVYEGRGDIVRIPLDALSRRAWVDDERADLCYRRDVIVRLTLKGRNH